MSWMHYLPPRFLPVIQSLPEALTKRITEVRLRLEKPFSITAGGRNLLPDAERNRRSAGWEKRHPL